MKVKKSWLRTQFGSRISNWEQRADALGLTSDTIIDIDLFEVLEYWDYTCAYCGVELDHTLHFDHAIPLSAKFVDGNPQLNTVGNLVCSCPDCNLKKTDKSFEDFANQDVKDWIYDWQAQHEVWEF